MNCGDVKTLVGSGVFESVTSYSRRGFVGDKLDRLNYTINDLHSRITCEWVALREKKGESGAHLVFDTRVFSLGVFTDDDRVDVVVRSLEAFN